MEIFFINANISYENNLFYLIFRVSPVSAAFLKKKKKQAQNSLYDKETYLTVANSAPF